MPWKVTDVLMERVRFVIEHLQDGRSMTELCQEYGVSRKTGYKWIQRFREEGAEGLSNAPRAPRIHPNATPTKLIGRLVQLRKQHPTWGAKKLLDWLRRHEPKISWPARSTVELILKRHGLVRERTTRRRWTTPSNPLAHATAPNQVWCTDFKGWFRVGNGERCDPLTIADAFSRYVLAARPVKRMTHEAVKPWFERAFRDHGLPDIIRSDNGPPFASTGRAGLSRLSAWWIRLGIRPERIAPGRPDQNGRLERFHRTLKQETACPPQRTILGQQRAFTSFLHEYNTDRPHEALDGAVPADLFERSPRPFPRELEPMVYPDHYEVRRVKVKGAMVWKSREVHVTEALAGQDVGLEPIEDETWRLHFGPVCLGVFNEASRQITDLSLD
jgi:putative transposase